MFGTSTTVSGVFFLHQISASRFGWLIPFLFFFLPLVLPPLLLLLLLLALLTHTHTCGWKAEGLVMFSSKKRGGGKGRQT